MRVLYGGCILGLILLAGVFPMAVNASGGFIEEFKNPPVEFFSAPLWVWNDDISEEEIAQQLDMFKEQRILQPYVHPRPGLITPYLSERWLDLYTFAVKAAKERGMQLHIYDENSYPSGFAGGHVPDQHPEWGGKGIVFDRVDSLPDPLPENTLAAYRIEGEAYKRIEGTPTDRSGPHAIARVVFTPASTWTAGFPYVDLLEPGLTEEFLRITLEPYKKRFGEEFGKTVRSVFTDEPHLCPAGSFHWTPRLPELFKAKYGYDFLDAIPSLYADTGDYRKVRFEVYQLLLEEFIERWCKPYHAWCEKNGLDFTGHYWEHGWPETSHGPDNMAMYAWHQMPAIDCLMNQYNEGTHAQFGNVRMVKELASVANQLGMKRRLCEVYGAGGWEMSFEDQKRIVDWLGVLGVNFFDQHLSYMTLRGPRKRDHPLSFTDHAPWWSHYHVLGDYIGRLSYVLSSGEEQNRILVLEPTTSGWLLSHAGGGNEALNAKGEEFQKFITTLSLDQVEYDLGSEQILRDHGKVEKNHLVVGKRTYDIVVLHSTCKNLASPTFQLLKDYMKAGGRVLCVDGHPSLVDGKTSEEITKVFDTPQEKGTAILYPLALGIRLNVGDQAAVSKHLADGYNSVKFADRTGGKLFHQFRKMDKGGVLVLCNTSKEENAKGSWQAEGKSVIQLDLFDGTESAVPVEGALNVAFDLPPCGSAVYFIGGMTTRPARKQLAPTKPVEAKLASITRVEPNVLTIDFCDYSIDGKEGKDLYFYKAQTAIYQARGFPRNPWDNAVQFKDNILRKDEEFREGSGFSVTYYFEVEGFPTPPALNLVVEQADRYAITLNGKPIKPTGKKWLDREFEVLEGGSAVVVGKNDLTLTSTRFSVHQEIEPIYVLGDFALVSAEKGWKITPAKALEYGSWKAQGLPFYQATVKYDYTIAITKEDASLVVSLPKWAGTVASVKVNGEEAGLIAWQPNQLEVKGLKKGDTTLSVEVIGSLKNLLGPHHGTPGLGAAWPGAFQHGPETGPPAGTAYDTIDYGLMEAAAFME